MNTFTMNEQTEEMMMRYLEGSLSPEETLRFESLLVEQPALADEVRALQSFDEALSNVDSGSQWLDKVDIGFLSDVQSQMAQIAASSASVGATAASAPAFNAAVSSSGVAASGAVSSGSFAALGAALSSAAIGKIALSLVACGLFGYGAWKFTVAPSNVASEAAGMQSGAPRSALQETSQELAPSAAPQTTFNPAQQDVSQAPSANDGRAVVSSSAAESPQSARQNLLENAAAEPQASSRENLPPASQAESDNRAQEDREKSRLQASIESSSAQDLRAKIDQLAAQLKTKEQSGDRLGVAFDAKKLGMLERAAGRYAESYEALSKALKSAQALKIRDLEGEILAETAVLYREQGNNDKALQTLREAVAMLSAEKSSKTARWEREYERWGGK